MAEQHNQPWYKPFLDLDEHHEHNLKHVNTYVGEIVATTDDNGVTTRKLEVKDYWKNFTNLDYKSAIMNHTEYGYKIVRLIKIDQKLFQKSK